MNTPIEADQRQVAAIDELALRLSNGASVTKHARAAAIAQVELDRVRAAKTSTLRLAGLQVDQAHQGEEVSNATRTTEALIACLPDLMRLYSYERKALSTPTCAGDMT